MLFLYSDLDNLFSLEMTSRGRVSAVDFRNFLEPCVDLDSSEFSGKEQLTSVNGSKKTPRISISHCSAGGFWTGPELFDNWTSDSSSSERQAARFSIPNCTG